MEKEIMLSAHDRAWQEAKDKMPVLKVGELVDLGVLFLKEEITLKEILDKYEPDYAEAIKVYTSCFGTPGME